MKKSFAASLGKISKKFMKTMAEKQIDRIKLWEMGDQQNPNSVYKNVEMDEFPVAQYVMKRVGLPISAMFSPPSVEHSSVCHYPEDIESIVKEFGFSRVHTIDTYDDEESAVVSHVTYECVTDSSVVIMRVHGYPMDLDYDRAEKLKKKKIRPVLFSGGDSSLYESVKRSLIAKYRRVNFEPNYVNLVIASPGGYSTEEFDLPKQTMDISLNYGDSFVPIHEKILNTLNTQKSKGLVLLHGDPGTGKTHYLKYLASQIKDKKVLFIPPYLADFITSPEMTPFLIENSNSILFIEDAERVITDRNENGTTGVSNILNITDGILSDILNIQIVATFNMDKKRIDPALLRKGRLIAEHKFGPLSIDDSNRLLERLNIDHKTYKEMTLTEIYNYLDDHYVSEENSGPRKIGFGAR